MARIPNRDAKDLFAFVAHRDGKKCFYQSPLCKGDLLLHHVDNNHENNLPANLRLACRGHNNRMHPRGRDKRHKKQYVREWERGRGGGGYKQREIAAEAKKMAGDNGYDDLAKKRVHSAEMEKNSVCEPAYRMWVEEMVMKHGRVKAGDLVNGGAEKVSCSQQTAKKYLDKMCSITGRFQYSKATGDEATFVEFLDEVYHSIFGDGKVAAGTSQVEK